MHDGLERSYRLHLPPDYSTERPAQLVLSIHGYTGSARFSELEWTGMSEHADRTSTIVVYPQSTSFAVTGNAASGGASPSFEVTSWNDLACSASPGPEGPTCAEDADPYPCPPECGSCGPCNWCSCHDDVGAIRALLDALEDRLCIDTDRVFVVGFSNGGMFTQRLGCALAERLTAVAPLAGTLARGFSCSPEGEPVSLLLLSGTADRTVPLDGSRSSDGYFYTPNEDVASQWASSQQCDPDATPVSTSWDGVGDLECVEHTNCANGSRVMNCSWNGRHDWPRVGDLSDPEARPFGNELLWWFFDSVALGSQSDQEP